MQSYVDEKKLIQYYYEVERRNKFSLLVHLLKKEARGLTLIFCSTRHIVDLVNRNIQKQQIQSEALHGGMTQNRRTQVMEEYRNGKLDVLVASDVAARGLDIKNVNLIINYDLPKTSQEYVHRIGRTARAGQEGKVISLLSPEDHENFSRVLEDRSLLVQKIDTPRVEQVMFVRPARRFPSRFPPSPRRFSRPRRYY